MEHYIMIFGIYIIRWQLSTPILSLVPILYKKLIGRKELSTKDIWYSIVLGNLIGALMFFIPDCILFHH